MGYFLHHGAQGIQRKAYRTLNANGKTSVVPVNLDPLYLLSPFKDATENTPPFIGFSEVGPFVQGPRGQATSLTTTLANLAPLTLWVADDAIAPSGTRRPATPPVTITITKYRGPGAVTLTPEHPMVERAEFERPPGSRF